MAADVVAFILAPDWMNLISGHTEVALSREADVPTGQIATNGAPDVQIIVAKLAQVAFARYQPPPLPRVRFANPDPHIFCVHCTPRTLIEKTPPQVILPPLLPERPLRYARFDLHPSNPLALPPRPTATALRPSSQPVFLFLYPCCRLLDLAAVSQHKRERLRDPKRRYRIS